MKSLHIHDLSLPGPIMPCASLVFLWRRSLHRWLAVFAAALAALVFAAPAMACGSAPAPGGNPNKPEQCAGAGNPINVMTGNKYQREEDMPALPGVLGLEIVRHYNSAFSGPGHPNGVIGRGWRLSYETELVDRWGKVQVLLAEGGRVIFDRDRNSPTGCNTPDPANGSMAIGRQPDGQSDYTWTWTDGRKLHFNAAGKLDRITASTGEILRLLYDSQNVLVRVIDPQGRSLNLVYYDRHIPNQFHGVQFIDTPVGRFAYEYGSTLSKDAGLVDRRLLLANLVRVRLPDHFDPDTKAHALSSRGTTRSTTSRIYHHEDPRSPWLMTGISIESIGKDGQTVMSRYATYGYDDTGRAILSTHANDVGKVTLDNHEAGKTVLTNSLGQKTVYRYTVIAGEYRLLEVRGAGCALCGEPNVRYRYDDAARLVETVKLLENGEPAAATKAARDKLGRITRVDKVVYQRGKPGPAQLQARFEYKGTAFAPVLVARPSVVPGKELVTRVDYNEAGQPLSVTESGWTPTADGKQVAERIERTVRYRYATINGRSLLAEIDGPLPNGRMNSPLDSDVTVFEYDHQPALSSPSTAGTLIRYERHDGLLTRVIAPGNLITEIVKRDLALRPSRLRRTDGDLVQDIKVTNNWRSAPLSLELTAGDLRRKVGYEYDALGEVAAVIMPGNLRTAFRRDSADRATLTVLPDGSGLRSEQDSENRTVRTVRLLDALSMGSTALAELRFSYDRQQDKPGKLAEIHDVAGLLERYDYDELGRVSLIRSALGIATAFAYDATGLLARRTDAADSDDAASIGLTYDLAARATGITAGNGVKTLRRYDDFGRKVLEADPDRGITIFRHDASGHVAARVDETMVITRYTYDHAGRLVAMGSDDKPDLVQYRYRGSQLRHVISTPDEKPEHATERTDYEHDGFGRVTKETRWLANVAPRAGAPAGFSFVTTSEYDEAGRLVSQTLPDGHRLHYRFAPADVNKTSGRRPGQLEAILFDDDVVVTGIEQTIAGGLTGYTMGNGARQQIKLDSRGRIEQLQVLGGSTGLAGWWRRIAAWFAGDKDAGGVRLYRQVNRYDADGRITGIDREMPSAESGRGQIVRSDTYAYDQMNRLTDIRSSDGTDTRYTYDKGGNRVLETVGTGREYGPYERASGTAPGQMVKQYAYASGTNRLIAITNAPPGIDKGAVAASRNRMDATRLMRDAWFYHATGVPLAQLAWTNHGERSNRRIVYNSVKRPIAVYSNEQLAARYHYNVQGERLAKTVYPATPALMTVAYTQTNVTSITTYSLYRNERLASEADDSGRITAHYVYLFGKPVAKIEMEVDDSFAHRFWKAIKLRDVPDAGDTQARLYAILTDHLGTPQQVMDESQHVIWQARTTAFGRTHVTYTKAVGAIATPFVMNLRLPGQVFDVETGFNYNYLRDYDPEVGRYTTPDPIGLGGGPNSYAYVSNNPLTNIDPLGLFQSDIHYYMTYFLAVVAGVNPEEARVIALAAQYIDDSPDTAPLNLSVTTGLTDAHRARLLTYHFTMVPSTINPGTGMVSGVANDPFLGYGTPPSDPRYINIPENSQLRNLNAAVATAGQATNLVNSRCTQLQFFGEYLHAFEDTFAHRDSNDMPFPLKEGLGHGSYGSNPDYTYNHISFLSSPGTLNWRTNEARTLEAEKEVFAKMAAWADPSKAKKISDIEQTLRAFNAIHESEGDGETTEERQQGYPTKIRLLQTALEQFGYSDINITRGERQSFNTQEAAQNRKLNLHSKDGRKLDQKVYEGTILPK